MLLQGVFFCVVAKCATSPAGRHHTRSSRESRHSCFQLPDLLEKVHGQRVTPMGGSSSRVTPASNSLTSRRAPTQRPVFWRYHLGRQPWDWRAPTQGLGGNFFDKKRLNDLSKLLEVDVSEVACVVVLGVLSWAHGVLSVFFLLRSCARVCWSMVLEPVSLASSPGVRAYGEFFALVFAVVRLVGTTPGRRQSKVTVLGVGVCRLVFP